MNKFSKGIGGVGGDADTVTEVGENDPNSGRILDNGNNDKGNSTTDNEINMTLNVGGYRKLNAYAHWAIPTMAAATSASALAPASDSSEQQTSQQVPQQPLHPTLVLFSKAIRTLARKIEHAVLD